MSNGRRAFSQRDPEIPLAWRCLRQGEAFGPRRFLGRRRGACPARAARLGDPGPCHLLPRTSSGSWRTRCRRLGRSTHLPFQSRAACVASFARLEEWFENARGISRCTSASLRRSGGQRDDAGSYCIPPALRLPSRARRGVSWRRGEQHSGPGADRRCFPIERDRKGGHIADRIGWRRTFDPVGQDQAALIGMCPSALPYSSPGTPCGRIIARRAIRGEESGCDSNDGDSRNQAT
jgi:hypothetical protein